MTWVVGIAVMVLVVAAVVVAWVLRWRKAVGKSEVANLKALDGAVPAVAAQEEQVEHMTLKLRGVLLGMVNQIRRAGSAADSSTLALAAVRTQVNNLEMAEGLEDAQTALLAEIDRVISANSVLKKQLEATRDELKQQRHEIEHLQTAVRVDSLTQLANRSAFIERLEESLAAFNREGVIFSLLAVDIDHFKNINDTHGHPAGDRILKGVALKMKAALRLTDFIARVGGEEFSIIIPKANQDVAVEIAEKLREAVEFSKFKLDDTELKVTISIGVSQVMPGDDGDSIVERADEALYRAKQSGRNRVRAANDNPEV